MDPISLVVGAALLAAGWLAGRIRRRTSAASTESYTCGCEHSYALHDRKSDECVGEVRRRHYYKNGARNGWEWAKCPCRRYVGDVPLDLTQFDLPSLPRGAAE